MTKLLRANFSRLWKSKTFWICLILTLGISVLNLMDALKNEGWQDRTAYLFTSSSANFAIMSGIFSPLFLGTDYSDRTMRNKLIIGTNRVNIYLANLFTISAAGIIFALANWLPALCVAVFGRGLGMDEDEFALQMLIIICAVIAMCAVFTLLGMLITAKSANTAISIVAAVVLLIGAAIIMDLLARPEFVHVYVEITETEIKQTEELEPNPAYIKPGLKRNILTAVNDVLPGGQIMQIETGQLHNEKILPLYSLGILAVTTAAGVAVFRRKDLK